MLKIGILLGDDIGREVVPECVKVMKVAAGKVGLDVEWEELPIGRRGHELHGHTLPKVTAEALGKLNCWVMVPIGHSAYPRNDPTWIMPPVRKRFELFASIKPVKSYPNLRSVHKDVDIVFVREVNEGMQSSIIAAMGAGEFRPNDEITIGTSGLRMRIDNVSGHLLTIGMVQGLFETALDTESFVDWDLSEEGDLTVEVTPRSIREFISA